jgi:hypothetical protein
VDPGDKLDKRLGVSHDLLHDTEIILVGSTFDSYPLMVLECSLAHLGANLDHLGHLGIGNHLNALPPDAAHPLNEGLDMGHVVGFDVDSAFGLIAVEDRKDHERLLTVQKINSLLE